MESGKVAFQCPAAQDSNSFQEKRQADGEQPPLQQKARNNFARKFAEKGAQWKVASQYSTVLYGNSFGEKQKADGEPPPLQQKARNNFVKEFAEKGAQRNVALPFSTLCHNFVNIGFKDRLFPYMGQQYNFVLHHFLDP